jgi:hypothetical protein
MTSTDHMTRRQLMTKESTGKVLEGILNDADLAGKVAEGDFTSFADEDLTDAERALLEAAAGDLDADVSGFAAFVKYKSAGPDSFVKLGDIEALSMGKWSQNMLDVFGHVGVRW